MVQKSVQPRRQQAVGSDRMARFGTFWHFLAPNVTGFWRAPGRNGRQAVGGRLQAARKAYWAKNSDRCCVMGFIIALAWRLQVWAGRQHRFERGFHRRLGRGAPRADRGGRETTRLDRWFPWRRPADPAGKRLPRLCRRRQSSSGPGCVLRGVRAGR